eukprot:CAMPEP_0172491112 /NCGR_PEP_ID=MMETSP1066-20121228/21817_1 /TAXON_ID=671091 /ORGANISM="Coscinodiscus wailesii, Strain CCMP2513" /LENGTH=208 /DNA_ID=CAMNT_0013259979 /DNA_START=449 /DNA_END=1075 /DNA_ORIENTATION=-
MILKSQSREAIGYFFITLAGARDVLADAKKAAAEGNYPEVWEDARITTVPLDLAMQLTLRTKPRMGQKDVSLDSICDVIPSADALDDALPLDGTGMYASKGRVPLFYIDGMELPPTSDNGPKRMPVFFSKKQLLKEWSKQNPNNSGLPVVKVRDLYDTYKQLLREDPSLSNLVVVPVEGTADAIRQVKAEGGADVKYSFDSMIMVGGK